MQFEAISFSADVADLRSNMLFVPEVAQQYPGASWASEMKKSCPWSIEFLTADVALARQKRGEIDAKRILVIQHNNDPESALLIANGAFPFMVTMFESPLYSPAFYDSIREISAHFLHVTSFPPPDGVIPNWGYAYFPSFSVRDLERSDFCAWGGRNFASAVVGNKYVLTSPFSSMAGVEEAAWWLGKVLRRKLAGSNLSKKVDTRKFQLQDARLDIITALLEREQLALFGGGWDKLYRLPPSKRRRLAKLLPVQGIARVDDKIATLANYKFNVCFENIAYPGYVTEKIFDAMLAKTVPVYLGAPDILDYVPQDAFIDASKFSDMEALCEFLRRISEREGEQIIRAGQDYLNSEVGRRYSYESMASRVLSLLCSVLFSASQNCPLKNSELSNSRID